MVDFELAGHECCRPAGVCQGTEEGDRPLAPKKQVPLLLSPIYQYYPFSLLSLLLCLDQHLSPRFEIKLKEGTKMLWKPGTLQLKNVKAKNVASYFSATQIKESLAVTQAGNSLLMNSSPTIWKGGTSKLYFFKSCEPMTQVWRLRVYKNEKVIGAAKPLVFLKWSLAMTKGQCQRIL